MRVNCTYIDGNYAKIPCRSDNLSAAALDGYVKWRYEHKRLIYKIVFSLCSMGWNAIAKH